MNDEKKFFLIVILGSLFVGSVEADEVNSTTESMSSASQTENVKSEPVQSKATIGFVKDTTDTSSPPPTKPKQDGHVEPPNSNQKRSNKWLPSTNELESSLMLSVGLLLIVIVWLLYWQKNNRHKEQSE